MNENGWQAIGRIAKARRERLGLKQDELAQYGGPGVATVGKFERAAQDSFPPRTQHQMENALGWSRTIVEQVVNSINEGALTAEDWEHDLVVEHVPDLSRPQVSAGDRTLDEALEALRSVLRLMEPDRLDDAVRAALLAIVPMLTSEGATRLGAGLRDSFPPEGGDGNADATPGGSAPTKLRPVDPLEVDEAAYNPEDE
jgi:transcriptional regulator with XRE-family HTH domain